MNQRALAAVLAVSSALVATALVTNVPGFELNPALRFGLTVGQAGITAAVAFLPAVRRRRQYPYR